MMSKIQSSISMFRLGIVALLESIKGHVQNITINMFGCKNELSKDLSKSIEITFKKNYFIFKKQSKQKIKTKSKQNQNKIKTKNIN